MINLRVRLVRRLRGARGARAQSYRASARARTKVQVGIRPVPTTPPPRLAADLGNYRLFGFTLSEYNRVLRMRSE